MAELATRDYYETTESLADHGMTWSPDLVEDRDGEAVVPALCHACGRPMFYDTVADDYRHALDPATGCFLIAAQPDARTRTDPRHPLIAAVVDSVTVEVDAILSELSDDTRATITA